MMEIITLAPLKGVHDFLVENIVALDFLVTPDVGLLSEQLPEANLENTVKLCDPTLLPLGQRLVVNVGVTDKYVIHDTLATGGIQAIWYGNR